ncbi:multicopper oxidase domain-containing protein [Bacillus sp. ISL-39]|uniref:multicopper oxidase family protein n=1 Tax=Bacillus sp. ISL-39 TaxID=2819124 RepID=UPI001BE594A1|nr:multicopper oxidase domain-containing protein [Bacillus sp. ISL-39]MBT2639278.1 multicopper oxidase domain-containing protein [Bacillus sp. ISL-39]
MNHWEEILQAPGLNKAKYKLVPGGRYFKLTVSPLQQKILKEVTLDIVGYNNSSPGPLIIVNEGDKVFIEVENRLSEKTALHVHGLSKPNVMDGMPEIEPTPFIEPGKSFRYEFIAWQSGSFFYHSSNPLQESNGLIGGFVVLPKNQVEIPHRDYLLLIQQWEIDQPPVGKIEPGLFTPKNFNRNPNFFTINGKSFPDTSPLTTKYGERVRLRFINNANMSHTMHIHGHDFAIVAEDAFKRKKRMMDTINLPSGKRFDIEFISANPGVWPVNGTKPFHKTNNGESPGGMLTRLIYN